MYIPCMLSIDTANGTYKVPGHTTEQTRWWDPKHSYLYHPYILLNFLNFKDDPHCRQDLCIGDDTMVLGDSGGFQLYTQNLDIDPKEVLKWQEDNCDRGFILDVAAGAQDTDEEFDVCLKKTIENCECFRANRREELKIYSVMHGHTDERCQKWFDEMSKFEFEGWSVSFKPPGDVFGQARQLMLLYKNGVRKNVHFLGISGYHVMPILVYASTFIDDVVFDSSSYGMGIRSRVYVMPRDLFKGRLLTFGDKVSDWHDLKVLPCGCPICSKIESVEELMAMGRGGGYMISLHNMWIMCDYIEKLKALVSYKELFRLFVEQNCNRKTLLALDYIDECLAGNYDEATYKTYAKFMPLMASTQEDFSFDELVTGNVALKKKVRSESAPKKTIKAGRRREKPMVSRSLSGAVEFTKPGVYSVEVSSPLGVLSPVKEQKAKKQPKKARAKKEPEVQVVEGPLPTLDGDILSFDCAEPTVECSGQYDPEVCTDDLCGMLEECKRRAE